MGTSINITKLLQNDIVTITKWLKVVKKRAAVRVYVEIFA